MEKVLGKVYGSFDQKPLALQTIQKTHDEEVVVSQSPSSREHESEHECEYASEYESEYESEYDNENESEYGSDLDIQDDASEVDKDDRETLVDLVYHQKKIEFETRLTNREYEQDELYDEYGSLLAAVAAEGFFDFVELILKHTDYYKAADSYKIQPLTAAVEFNKKDVVKVLLDAFGSDIDLNIPDEDEDPVLHIAAANKSNEILQMLLQAGALATTTAEDGITPLHCAAQAGNVRGVQILLQAHANINAQTDDGKTPLHYAVEECDDEENVNEVVLALLMADAALNIADNDKKTPLDCAVRADLKIILEKEPTFRKEYPIHCIVRNGNKAKLLQEIFDGCPTVVSFPCRWKANNNIWGREEEWIEFAVDVVAVPSQNKYYFTGYGHGTDLFTVEGFCEGNRIEITKHYHEQSDDYTGVFNPESGEWTQVDVYDEPFPFKIPRQSFLNCKEVKVTTHDPKTCLSCLPQEYNANVDEVLMKTLHERLHANCLHISEELQRSDEFGRTALTIAASEGRANILDTILKLLPADALEVKDHEGKTALDHALSRELVCKHRMDEKNNEDTLQTIEMLMSFNTQEQLTLSDIPSLIANKINKIECTKDCAANSSSKKWKLVEAAKQRDWNLVNGYLKKEVPDIVINKIGKDGLSVLHFIAQYGELNILSTIVKQKHLNINLPDENGMYALSYAAEGENRATILDCVKVLLNAGADPLKLKENSWGDPLDSIEVPEVVELLKTKQKLKKEYPLYWTAGVENYEEAQRHVKNKESSLHAAVLCKAQPSILLKIIEMDTTFDAVNGRNKKGETPLMLAARAGLLKLAQTLTNKGANVDLVNHAGKTALMIAADEGKKEVVAHLLKQLADIEMLDNDGNSVLTQLSKRIKEIGRKKLPKLDNYQDIYDKITSDIRMRQKSVDYRTKLALSLAQVSVKDAFYKNGFSKAINCSPELGVTFLNDCVTMDRHDIQFKHLEYVYGKDATTSPLYTLLHMKTDIPDLIFEAKSKCFEHVVMQRILEIKWELFGQRKFVEMLLMNLLLLVSMTISAILFENNDATTIAAHRRLTAAESTPVDFVLVIGMLSISLTIVGYIVVQGLKPRILWRLARYHSEGTLEFNPSVEIQNLERCKAIAKRNLKVVAFVATIILTLCLIGLMYLTNTFDKFPLINNIVLGGCSFYFLITEFQEARSDLSTYLTSTINVIQVFIYTIILALYMPMQLNWLETPDPVEIVLGSVITLTLWILTLQFLEVEKTVSYLLPVLSGLLRDLWNFFILFGVFQIGITITFYQLYKATDHDSFNTLSSSFWTSYFVTFGQVPMDSLGHIMPEDSRSKWDWLLYFFAGFMIMAHSALVVIFLLNMLMALMNKTVDGGIGNAKTEALAAYARCILRLEEAMNLNEKETKELIYLAVPGSGPKDFGVINPIFNSAMPKSHYATTSELEDLIENHPKLQQKWLDAVTTLKNSVSQALEKFDNELHIIEHFTSLDVVTKVLCEDFAAIKTTKDKLDQLFSNMAKCRGQQYREELLSRFKKNADKEMNELDQRLRQIWAKKDKDRERCVLIYELIYGTTMLEKLDSLKDDVKKHFKETLNAIGNDAKLKDTSMDDRMKELEQKIARATDNIVKQLQDVVKSIKSTEFVAKKDHEAAAPEIGLSTE